MTTTTLELLESVLLELADTVHAARLELEKDGRNTPPLLATPPPSPPEP